MDCRCDKCVEEEKEYERLKVLAKLNHKEMHIINMDFKEQKKAAMFMGICIGLLGGIGIGLSWVLL
jgi:hypothetical protein